MRVESKDKKFFAEFDVLTPLEILDIDVSERDSESFIFASEVALAVTDWNGDGKIDPLELISNRNNHKYVYLVSRAIDATRPKIPHLRLEETEDAYILIGNDFYIKIRDMTVLEFMDVVANHRKQYGDDLQSIYKCKLLAAILLDWNGEGRLSGEQIHEDKDKHPYVVATDTAITNFFREEFTLCESNPVLDDMHTDGRDDSEPISVESEEDKNSRISFNVARV